MSDPAADPDPLDSVRLYCLDKDTAAHSYTRFKGVDGRPRLTGWPAIEEFAKKYDKNLVEGYKDDIETLLIFVSLSVRLALHIR